MGSNFLALNTPPKAGRDLYPHFFGSMNGEITEKLVAPEADGGRVIDFSESQDAPRFIKGERVRHPTFGRGIIRELTGLGTETKAVIEFESVGRKKVVLRYANLQKDT